jgi:hypothetical protein
MGRKTRLHKQLTAWLTVIDEAQSARRRGVGRGSPWHDVKALGKMLDRKKALAHPWLREVFHVVEHIVREDPDVRKYLEGQGRKRRRLV